jgi:oligosaccharide repeat unit polymerase
VSQVLTAVAAVLIALVVLWCGRRDVSRPAVAFGVPWFSFLALAQLRLTDVERPWSTGFTLVAFGGGLAFVVAALLAGGSAGVRGTFRIERDRVNARRLIVAAVVLILAAVASAIYRAHVIGGVPLLSANPDEVRFRAIRNGDSALPGWSSALTGGFYIGLWAALAAIWVLAPRVRRRQLAPLWLLAAGALFGVALEASRNLVLFAVVVPALGAYLLTRARGKRGQAGWLAAAVCVLLVGVGGLYLLRLARGDGAANTYLSQQIDEQPAPVRPLVPLYVNGVFPIEAARRVYEAVPGRLPYELGGASFMSLPDRAFPKGKSQYPRHVSILMTTRGPEGITWTVASYQGRLLADLGWLGALLGSILIGLGFGSLYRWARGRDGFLPVAAVAYVAYYSAFMVYDNSLSFSVIAVYDLGVIALVSAYALGWTDRTVAAFKQARRSLAASERSTT